MSSSLAGAPKGSEIQFGRFVNSKIELFTARTTDITYIAISHVWGEAEWLPLKIAEREILVSKKKAKFMEDRLPELVGQDAFWMDVVCVDQRDPNAVFAAMRVSPDIFGNASRTIAIKAGDGFFQCCTDSIRNATTYGEVGRQLTSHVSKHWKTTFQESYLRRVWTLQEIVWSNNVHFVSDYQPPPDDARPDWKNMDWHAGFDNLKIGDNQVPNPLEKPKLEPYAPQTSTMMVLDLLFMMSRSFFLNPKPITGLIEFIKAYMGNGSISRDKKLVRTDQDDIFTYDFLEMHAASTKAVSKPADYILATMSQFSWYSHSENLLEISFSDLFQNFFSQASAAGHPLTCRITRSMTFDGSCTPLKPGEEWLPSLTQPEPQGIGEFFKLLGKKTKAMDAPENYYIATKAIVVAIGPNDINMTMKFIECAMKFSWKIWFETSRGGELGRYGDQPESTHDYGYMLSELNDETEEMKPFTSRLRGVYDMMKKSEEERWAKDGWAEEQSYKILNLLFLSTHGSRPHAADWESVRKHDIPNMWSKKLQETLLLLAAIISCQLPLSALPWVRQRFEVVALSNSNEQLLCLLAKHACTADITSGQRLYVVGRHVAKLTTGQDLLLATTDTVLPVGLIPDFLPVDRSDEDLVNYMVGMSKSGFPIPVEEMRSKSL